MAPQAFLVLALLSPSVATARGDAPWGRFRGPNGSGVADAGPLPDAIGPEDGAVWRTELPGGYSSPVVGEKHVFLTAVEGTTLLVFAIDRRTGEVAWSRKAPEGLERPHPGPNSPVSSTPATDGTNVFAFFETSGIVAWDAKGKERWRRDFGPFNTPYGMGSSPILVDGLVVMQCDLDTDSCLIALDASTGEQRWKTLRPGFTHGFSTPTVYAPAAGPKQLVVSGSYRLGGYSVANGELLWQRGGMAWQAKSVPLVEGDTLYVHSWMASPAELGLKKITLEWRGALESYDADDDGRLERPECGELGLDSLWFLFDLQKDDALDQEEWSFVLARGTAENGLYAFQIGDARGDLPNSRQRWRYDRALPNIPSPLLYQGVLYVLKEGGILSAIDPGSGELLESGRIEGAPDAYFASPVAADGKLFLANHAGRFAVVRAGEDWEVLAVRDFEEEIWATPAIAGEQLFVRTQKALYGFEKLD